MRKPFVLLLASLVLPACAAHRPAGTNTEDWFDLPPALRTDPATLRFAPLHFDPPEPRVERLPNGLTVYLLEDHEVPLVQMRALVRLGNLDDPPEKAGLAQVAWSTLQTGGAGPLDAQALDAALGNMAALLEGEVGDEGADLALEVRAADLERGLRLLADLLRHPRFDPAGLTRVLDQGRDALERRRDDAGHVAQVAFAQALWGPSSPFSREATPESLEAISREDIVKLHHQAVVPGATRLVLTGDFDSASVVGRLQVLFGDWASGAGLQRRLPAPPPLKGRQVLVVPTSGAQAKIRLGHLGPARHDPRELAVQLVDAVLGGAGGPSRLYTEIRDKRGLAYSVESGIGPGAVRGVVLVAVDTKPESVREVIGRCIEALEAIRGPQPPSQEEVELAREGFINAFAFRFETAARAAYVRALQDARGYAPDYSRSLRQRLRALQHAEVAAAAREVLDPHALQIVVAGDPRRIGDLSEFGPVRVLLGTSQEEAE
ncbi:MAG: insulinase family protein [Deltaproteobacteria bacterium]|nr:insulinase family protein [Deltaproteobacteria bacterium]